jgi:NCS1 family nucleobase:cation symporter-1
VPADKRTFRAVDFAALWVTLVISVSSYYLAASLVDLGMCWWQVRVPVAVVAGWL